MKQTVIIAVPTAYEDPVHARRAVAPYIRDMRVKASIIEVRDERPGDDPSRKAALDPGECAGSTAPS